MVSLHLRSEFRKSSRITFAIFRFFAKAFTHTVSLSVINETWQLTTDTTDQKFMPRPLAPHRRWCKHTSSPIRQWLHPTGPDTLGKASILLTQPLLHQGFYVSLVCIQDSKKLENLFKIDYHWLSQTVRLSFSMAHRTHLSTLLTLSAGIVVQIFAPVKQSKALAPMEVIAGALVLSVEPLQNQTVSDSSLSLLINFGNTWPNKWTQLTKKQQWILRETCRDASAACRNKQRLIGNVEHCQMLTCHSTSA